MTMNGERIRPGDIVQHFKGGIYLVIITEAYWHEDKEKNDRLVIYRSALDNKVCVRPYDMFCSEVDRQKYPGVKQQYRFEVIDKISL